MLQLSPNLDLNAVIAVIAAVHRDQVARPVPALPRPARVVFHRAVALFEPQRRPNGPHGLLKLRHIVDDDAAPSYIIHGPELVVLAGPFDFADDRFHALQPEREGRGPDRLGGTEQRPEALFRREGVPPPPPMGDPKGFGEPIVVRAYQVFRYYVGGLSRHGRVGYIWKG